MPDLLGGPIDVTTTTVFTPTSLTVSSVPTESRNAAPIAAHPDSPSGPMLILAGLTWLLSLAAVLVYAEDQRSLRWKHLAR